MHVLLLYVYNTDAVPNTGLNFSTSLEFGVS